MLRLFFAFTILLSFCDNSYALTEEEIAQNKERRVKQNIKNLNSKNYMSFEKATYFFELMGEEAVSHLVKALKDDDNSKRMRINAIYVLGRLGNNGSRAVFYIMPFLSDEDSDYRAVAARAIGRIGGKTGVVALSVLLDDDDDWVKESAIKALKKIGTIEAKSILVEYNKSR